MLHLIKEAYNTVNNVTGYNVNNLDGFYSVIQDPQAFAIYAKGLAEGLEGENRIGFLKLARNTRKNILENSMMQLQPYETLTIPILRNFYPKLIAKELVNVMPIDKPEVIKAFIKPLFRRMAVDRSDPDNPVAAYSGYDYEFPSIDQDISRGPRAEFETVAQLGPGLNNLLDMMGLDKNGGSKHSHIEKDLRIVGITRNDSDSAETPISVSTTVDGNFSALVTHGDGTDDVISGHVNWLNGDINWASQTGDTSAIKVIAFASLEENTINPTVQYNQEKIRFTVVDRRLTSTWSTNIEQDAKALFDINVQSELVNIMGEQIALDIDREIINALIDINYTQNDASHVRKFYTEPDANFALGKKEWAQQIIPELNILSAQIYNSTFMGPANTIACNPLDAAVFESLNGFEYLGNSTAGGEVGYRSATVGSGKWKLLVSSIVPKGKVITKYRSDDLARAVYVFAPYVPALLIPYPLGPNPSLTIQSRYANQVIRNKGIGVLEVEEGVKPVESE